MGCCGKAEGGASKRMTNRVQADWKARDTSRIGLVPKSPRGFKIGDTHGVFQEICGAQTGKHPRKIGVVKVFFMLEFQFSAGSFRQLGFVPFDDHRQEFLLGGEHRHAVPGVVVHLQLAV